MMPLEYMCGWMGIGRSGRFTNVTSGGSVEPWLATAVLDNGAEGCKGGHTNGVRRAKFELETVYLAAVKRVVVEHADVERPLVKVFGRYELYPRWQRVVYLRESTSVAGCRRGSSLGGWEEDLEGPTFWSSFASRLFAKERDMTKVESWQSGLSLIRGGFPGRKSDGATL